MLLMILAKAARIQGVKNNKLFYMIKNNPVVGNYRCVQGGEINFMAPVTQ